MIKKLVFVLLFSFNAAHAFEGAHKYTVNVAGVEHVLTLDHWTVDKSGVPSLDYVYEQHAGKCTFRLAGHAIAGTEEIKGKVRVIEYPNQDSKGRELPAINMYDSQDLSLTLPAKGTYSTAGVIIQYSDPQRKQACAKGDEYGLRVSLRK